MTARFRTSRDSPGLPWAQIVTCLVLLVGVFARGVWQATPASAHAVVVSSTPRSGERLQVPPAGVTITFSEPVTPGPGGLEVLNSAGTRVDTGEQSQPQPDQLSTRMDAGAGTGTFVANYRVLSADGHAVRGAISFSVGAEIDTARVEHVAVEQSARIEALGAAGRLLAYGGTLLAAGLAFFVAYAHDGDAGERRRFLHTGLGAAAAGAAGQLVVMVSQAALFTGAGIGSFLDRSTLELTLSGSLGWSTLVLAASLVAVVVALRLANDFAAQIASFYGVAGAGTAFALWGHSIDSSSTAVTIVVDAVHGAAASVWFGGLIGLAMMLAHRVRSRREVVAAGPREITRAGGRAGVEGALPNPDAEATAGVIARFSTIATVCITMIVLAGLVLSWFELGSIGALAGTTYGRVLALKVVIFLPVVALVVFNHFWLLPFVLGETPRSRRLELAGDQIEADRWNRLARSVRIESLGVIVVLAITAVLVNITPAASERAAGGSDEARPEPTGVFSEFEPVGSGKVNLEIVPARVGSNAIHITYQTDQGLVADLAQSVTIEMSLPEKGIGPLRREVTKTGVGHFMITAMPDFAVAGIWDVTLVSRLSEFQSERTTFKVPIDPP